MEEFSVLSVEEYHTLAAFMDLNTPHNKRLAKKAMAEIATGNRRTYVYKEQGVPLGKISLVLTTKDPEYTIPGQRAYISRLVVGKEHRRKGIGRKLLRYAEEQAVALGYIEITVGVDIDNIVARWLYETNGYTTILFAGTDEAGRYVKLLKYLGSPAPSPKE